MTESKDFDAAWDDPRRDRELLNTLLENIPDSIYFKDTDSRFLKISRAMAKKFGMTSPSEVTGQTDADIFSDEHAQTARRDELRIMETGEPIVEQVERETWPNRPDTWCLTTKMPLRTKSGHVIGTFGISRDITELKQSQDALRDALEAADKASRAKSDFLANMSHEIRTPMNAIIGMSELLSNTQLQPEQKEYVGLVKQSAAALLGLINDILDFSKIEARKLELEAIPFSIRETVGRTCQTMSIRANDKSLELAFRIAPDVPDQLIGDPGRIRQVLLNLIGNAIKFTERGEVVVDVDLFADTDRPVTNETACLRFSVADTGIGIPEPKQAAVMEAFTQADASTTRQYGGTGLGLAICRQLVELMNGEIQLESAPGVGTTFSFMLPMTRAHMSTDESTPPAVPANPDSKIIARELAGLDDFRILVVDDNATNRRILDEVLGSWKIESHLAADGPSAITEIRQAIAEARPYSLVLLDCMMPGMDGFETARQIQTICQNNPIRLIMLTSATRSGDSGRCRSTGIARLLTKPVLQSELLETIFQVMDIGQPRSFQPAKPVATICRALHVLVAEDGLANQQVAIGLLRAAGHTSVVASDGQQTIDAWSNEFFDVILMDMHMPVMDGLEATQIIRRQETITGDHIPIIALTAAAMEDDAKACLAAGMDAHVAKPIEPQKLQTTLASLCDRPENKPRSTSRPSIGPATESAAGPEDESTGGPKSTTSSTTATLVVPGVIDFGHAATRVPGGRTAVARLATVFADEAERLMRSIELEMETGDVKAVGRAAHTLKGSATLFKATKVHEIAERIEQAAQQDQLPAATPHIPRLRQATDEMVSLLRQFVNDADKNP